MYYRKIIDVKNNTETIEELSDSEIAEIEQNIELAKKENEKTESKTKQRQEIFQKLGLTEEEAKLLLG